MTNLDFKNTLISPSANINFTSNLTPDTELLFLELSVVLATIRDNAILGHPESILAVQATTD